MIRIGRHGRKRASKEILADKIRQILITLQQLITSHSLEGLKTSQAELESLQLKLEGGPDLDAVSNTVMKIMMKCNKMIDDFRQQWKQQQRLQKINEQVEAFRKAGGPMYATMPELEYGS